MSRQKTIESIACLLLVIALFALFSFSMGLSNTLNTMMNTAYRVLMDTTFFIMALAVLAGALSALFSEFGVIDLLNRLLSPLMKPLYGMPGAAALGIVTTYLSDNPAILALGNDKNARQYFKRYQIPALTNLGTAFGMGLIVTSFILGQSGLANVGKAALCGNLGAIIGSIISTRLMMIFTKRKYGRTEGFDIQKAESKESGEKKNVPMRVLSSLLDGGKNGVDLGLGIIPGVVVICTFVMMLTYSAPADGIYTGAAYEGIGVIPFLADKINFILKPLFGFSSSSAISVPLTALGSAGAALGMIPKLIAGGLANSNDVAVFTAMCMCWSGYLSTHISMMDVLGCSDLTGKAILTHTIGGLCAGVSAHFLFMLLTAVM